MQRRNAAARPITESRGPLPAGHVKQTNASGTRVIATLSTAATMSASPAVAAHEAGQKKSTGNGPYIQVLTVPSSAVGYTVSPWANATAGASRMSFHGIEGKRNILLHSQTASIALAKTMARRVATRIPDIVDW